MWWNVRNGQSKRVMDPSYPAHGSAAPSVAAEHSDQTQFGASLREMIDGIHQEMSYLAEKEQDMVKQELAKKAREWCVQDINHDLRTPLNAIIGFAQMMENGTLGPINNPQYLDYLRHIRESGYELLNKVESLLSGDEQVQQAPAQPWNTQYSELHEAVA